MTETRVALISLLRILDNFVTSFANLDNNQDYEVHDTTYENEIMENYNNLPRPQFLPTKTAKERGNLEIFPEKYIERNDQNYDSS